MAGTDLVAAAVVHSECAWKPLMLLHGRKPRSPPSTRDWPCCCSFGVCWKYSITAHFQHWPSIGFYNGVLLSHPGRSTMQNLIMGVYPCNLDDWQVKTSIGVPSGLQGSLHNMRAGLYQPPTFRLPFTTRQLDCTSHKRKLHCTVHT